MASRDIFDFDEQFASFIPMAAQAQHLIDHLVLHGEDWGRMYRQALVGRIMAPQGSDRERWFQAIITEMCLRITGAALSGIY